MTVSLSMFAGVGAQFSDDNGAPLAGGLVYVYLAGGTTPTPTYQTSAGSGGASNSNPIVLDSAGRVPYQIWLTDEIIYKFVLKTSGGSTVRTEDNVYGASIKNTDNTVKVVATYSNISAALATMAIGQQFSLLGHTTQGVGGGIFDVVSSVGLTADTGTIVINGARAAVRQAKTVYPEDFGVVNGVGTAAFQAFVNYSGAKIILSSITLASAIALPSNCKIKFKGEGEIVWDTASFDFAFTASAKTNIKLLHPVFRSTSSITARETGGLVISGCQNVQLISPKSTNCNVLMSQATIGKTYASVDANPASGGFNCSRYVVVTNPRISGPGAVDQASGGGIGIFYTLDWSVSGGIIENCGHGILYWGGNSDEMADGALANERKCKRGNVTGVISRNHKGAGFWGSMGDKITSSNLTISDCGDVGIDFEGSIDCSADGGTVTDCANGCLTAFFLNRNVSFNGVTAVQNTSGLALFRIYNSGLTQNNKSIIVDGCVLSSPAGIGFADTANGPCASITFTNNELTNVAVDFTANNNKIINVSGNTLAFDYQLGSAGSAIYCGGVTGVGNVNVKNNEIISSVVQTAGKRGIRVRHTDFNDVAYFNVFDNQTINFPIDIETDGGSANAGIYGVFKVRRNVMGGGVFTRTISGAGGNKSYLSDNETLAGGNYPTSLGAGTWEIGQKAIYNTPASGGFIGEILTGTGVKTFGLIS